MMRAAWPAPGLAMPQKEKDGSIDPSFPELLILMDQKLIATPSENWSVSVVTPPMSISE